VHHRRVDVQPLRVIIAEDSALIREGLARLIGDSGGVIVAKVGDGPSFVAAVVEHRPDVSVVDVRMPPTQRDEGLRAAIEARRRVPGTPVLVLSQYVERQYATELLADRAGGVGYLLKDRVADIREFMDALRRVARGGTALDPEVVAQLMVPRRSDDRLNAAAGATCFDASSSTGRRSGIASRCSRDSTTRCGPSAPTSGRSRRCGCAMRPLRVRAASKCGSCSGSGHATRPAGSCQWTTRGSTPSGPQPERSGCR